MMKNFDDAGREDTPAPKKRRPFFKATVVMLIVLVLYGAALWAIFGFLGVPFFEDAYSAPSESVYHGGGLHTAMPQQQGHSYTPPSSVSAPALETPQAAATPTAPIALLQNPELPNGCEATSLAIMLGCWGYAADKLDLAYDYIPRQDFGDTGGARTGPDPNTAYAGDPASTTGFYCFAAPVVQGANAFIGAYGGGQQCIDLSGSDSEVILDHLRGGTPVMLWVTLELSAPRTSTFTWTLPNGNTYTPYSNLHCVVAYGVSDQTLLVCDPLHGNVTWDLQTALDSYVALGAHAAVIV